MVWRSILEGRALRRAFMISIALNCFLVAAAIAIALTFPPPSPPPPPSPEHIAERMASNLSPEGRQHLLEVFQQHRDLLVELKETMDSERHEARRLFAADQFDTQALKSARAAARASFMNFLAGIDGVLTEAAQELSPEDRRRLLEGFPP